MWWGGAFEIRCLGVSHVERRHLIKGIKGMREGVMQTFGGKNIPGRKNRWRPSRYFRSSKKVTVAKGERERRRVL